MAALVRWEGAGRCGVSIASVRRRAEAMLHALGISDAELSVLLCDDARIRELNRVYRARDRPTDVLAFAMREGQALPSPVAVLGDVVISVPTARTQAAAHGRKPLQEVTLLLAHGLLHLLGFDHRTAAEERRMRARTDLLIAAASGRTAR